MPHKYGIYKWTWFMLDLYMIYLPYIHWDNLRDGDHPIFDNTDYNPKYYELVTDIFSPFGEDNKNG